MTTAEILQYARIMKLDGGEGSGVRGHTTEHASRLASAREATAKGEHNGDWGAMIMAAPAESGIDKTTGFMKGADYAAHMPNTPAGGRVIYKGGHDYTLHHNGEVHEVKNNERLTSILLEHGAQSTVHGTSKMNWGKTVMNRK
jgi:hypothetical protein